MSKYKVAIAGMSLFSSVVFANGEIFPATTSMWSGLYGGGNIGAVNHILNVTDTNATSFNATIQEVSNPKFTGGLQVGYRRQLDFNQVSGVYGLEFNADFSSAKFNKDYGSPYALYELSAYNELNNVLLLELTGGIAADKTLLFFVAGLSWSNIQGNLTSLSGIPFFNSVTLNKEIFGTVLGGGMEYKYSKNFSFRFKLDVVTPNTYSANDDLGNSFEVSNNIVQGVFGLNYKFEKLF